MYTYIVKTLSVSIILRISNRIYKKNTNKTCSLQTQSKASTISSGARAAAQTLNVPIERLEAQIHPVSNNKSPSNINNNSSTEKLHHRDHDEIKQIEYNGNKSVSPINYHHQQQQQSNGNHNGNVHHKTSNASYHHQQQEEVLVHGYDQDDEQQSLMAPSPSVLKYSLLQFAMQHFRNE